VKSNKPYKSLKDVYSENVNGYVAPRRHLRVLGEDYKMHVTDEAGNTIYSKDITDEMYSKIQKDVDRDTRIDVESGSKTPYEIIDDVLALDGWKQGNKNYTKQVYEPVKNAFHTVDINAHKFGNLIQIQTDPNNPFRTELLTNPGKIYNYYDLISPGVYELFATDQDAKSVIDDIWDTDTKIGNMAVGNGEIVITLFSDAKKGVKGDLELPGIGEVELKGCGARMGGDKFAHTNTTVLLNKILENHDVNVGEFLTGGLREELLRVLNARLVTQERKGEGVEEIKSIIGSVDNIETEDDITRLIDQIEGLGFSPNITKILTAKANKFLKSFSGKVKGEFSGAINVFFRPDWNLSTEEIVDGLVATRNYGKVNEGDLRQGLMTIVSNEGTKVLDARRGDPKTNIARLIAAIHMACYQQVEGFEHIVLADDGTKDMVSIDFSAGESLDQLVIRLYQLFKDLDLTINLSVDSYSGSTGISLNTCKGRSKGD